MPINAIPVAPPSERIIFDNPVACAKSFPRKPDNAIDITGIINAALPIETYKKRTVKNWISFESGDENERRNYKG